MRRISFFDADYPPRLRDLEHPPDELTLSAPLGSGAVVAIVGTREPSQEASSFARLLAAEVARAGAIVASGAAVGIDRAVHEGAIAAGGRTWAVVPSGCDRFVPIENEDLHQAMRSAPGSAVLWPFREGSHQGRSLPYLERNGVLAALADVVVVVQARWRSGARNTAGWARKLGRPLWVVPTPPWEPWMELYAGCAEELERGARPLTSVPRFLDALGLCVPLATRPAAPSRPRGPTEQRLLGALSSRPKHADQLALEAGLDAASLATALLTLALENVVVEGPSGFFRKNTVT